MEEQVIIKSKKHKIVLLVIQISCLLIAAVIFMIPTLRFLEIPRNYYYSLSYFYHYGNSMPRHWWPFMAIPLTIAIIFTLAFAKVNITVTNKRVYGVALLGKRVDLPLDSISSVGTSFLNGIDVGTSSGYIKFKLIKNHKEIHSALSRLLIERQNEEKSHTAVTKETSSKIDDLKKYKELLDSGVITQDEFDAKKKQILEV